MGQSTPLAIVLGLFPKDNSRKNFKRIWINKSPSIYSQFSILCFLIFTIIAKGPGSIRVRPGPSGSVRVHPGPSGSVRVCLGPSRSIRVRQGPSGPSGSIRVRPGPTRTIQHVKQAWEIRRNKKVKRQPKHFLFSLLLLWLICSIYRI